MTQDSNLTVVEIGYENGDVRRTTRTDRDLCIREAKAALEAANVSHVQVYERYAKPHSVRETFFVHYK